MFWIEGLEVIALLRPVLVVLTSRVVIHQDLFESWHDSKWGLAWLPRRLHNQLAHIAQAIPHNFLRGWIIFDL